MKNCIPRFWAIARACGIVFVVIAMVGNESSVHAVNVDIKLNTNPPPISGELNSYKSTFTGGFPFVGFDGADIGNGSGDGLNELVAFSFEFSPLQSVSSALLTLELTSNDTSSDQLFIADNNSPLDPFAQLRFYGNDLLRSLPLAQRSTVTFNLLSLGTNVGFAGLFSSEDVSSLLLDGDFHVVYDDDAFVHSARLEIQGVAVPEPGTLLLGVIAGVVCLLPRRR